MRKVSVILALGCLLVASPAFAQQDWTWNKSAFVFGAGGGTTGYSNETFFHAGGGFETIANKGVGFAVDLGYLGVTDFAGEGVAMVSGGVVYEVPVRGNLRPYGRVGIGWITNFSGFAGFWNFGGGVNYWFRDRYGLKVEVRDNVAGSSVRDGILEVMVGVMFRF